MVAQFIQTTYRVEQTKGSVKIGTRPQVSDYALLHDGTAILVHVKGWYKIVEIQKQKIVAIIK